VGTLRRGVEASEHSFPLQATQATDSWQPIPFNETDWQRDGAPTYRIEDGVLVFDGDGRGQLMTRRKAHGTPLRFRNIFIRPL
jgi:hypothetical protein